MLFTKTALVFSYFALLTVAQDDADASSKGISPGRGRTPNPSSSKMMFRRDLTKRCTGSCEECFGSGYTLCPGSEIFCYLPGDSSYGLDSCTSDGSGSDTTPTSSAPASTSTSGVTGIDDLCSQVGATCVSCFGPTYLDCPDGYHCYDPTDPNYDTCPDNSTSSGGGSGGSSGGSTTTESCAEQWGAGNIPCGTDGCYDPTIGESCCAGGFYCDAGYSCSSTLGKCSYDGGSLGGGLGGSSSSYTNPPISYSYATSTQDNLLGAATGTPTTTSAFGGSTSTGITQNLGSGSGANALTVGMEWGLLVAAGVGALVL
ncbi:hypothetical protein H2200_001594 [Cladophialophora chaetospira]|uniref:GPI anchored protein n=1 Tax=Cladophialophora chaetospira TaxID=386627 RepID=A0AA39CP80_9EURO|nr:hypothetical protein H2200_001594 [Cladophialophora chaetospira]